MNMLAMTELQKKMAEQLDLEVGIYLDFTNSTHIYEKTYVNVERFVGVAEKRLKRR